MAFQEAALKGYNKASYWQKLFQLEKASILSKNLKSALRLTNGPINIVDYGCSEGYNSMIFFNKVLKEFRTISERPVTILHTDLPDNNWSELNNILIHSEDSYLKLSNTFYSTLGRSFYDKILPNNSVHLGFSSQSFHYLSKKPIKKEGETGIMHSEFIKQANLDIFNIIDQRINELVLGGTLTVLIGYRSEELNLKMGRFVFEPFGNLIKSGIITQQEFNSFEFNTYSLSKSEWNQLLDKFSKRAKVLEFQTEKSICPYYLNYLQNKDINAYKNDLAEFIMQIINVLVETNFKRSLEEKKKILELLRNDIKRIIESDPSEQYLEFATIVLEKISN